MFSKLKTNSNVDMASNIKSIASSSHPISFEFSDSPKDANVTFASGSDIPAKDFILSIKVADVNVPSSRIQEDSKGNQVIMASFAPRLGADDDPIYSEFVIYF